MDLNIILQDTINKLNQGDSTLIVLKGIKDYGLKENNVSLEKIIENKMGYFLSEIYQKKNVISYDEYLCLYPIINMQYENIRVIENNIYMNLFPLNIELSDEIKNKLLCNFDDEKEGDKYEIGNLNEYLEIYSNFKKVDDRYYVTYNENLDSLKEEIIKLIPNMNSSYTEIKYVSDQMDTVDLNDEEDYIKLLNRISLLQNENINVVNKKNYITKVFLTEKLNILKEVYKNNVNITLVSKNENLEEKYVRDDYKKILKKYWGHDNFRNIKVYDMCSLDKNEKKVKEISQGEIIESIVSETEKCMNNEDYRDIFVTAPTGAGKSVMF